jgi:hypothetical protein
MDKRVAVSLRARLLASLAAAVPPAQREHPDAQVLLELVVPPDVDDAALMPLVDALDLCPIEHAAVSLALWVELDARMAAAVSLLQSSVARVGSSRPTLGLLASVAAACCDEPAAGASVATAVSDLMRGAAVASGLLQLGDAQQLSHARTVSIAPALVGLLAGAGAGRAGHAMPLGRIGLFPLSRPSWPLPRAWRDGAGKLGQIVADAVSPCVIVLRGADRDELGGLAAHLAHRTGHLALEMRGIEEASAIEPDALAMLAQREGVIPALLLCRALPVWHAGTAPGVSMRLTGLPHWPGPLIVLAGPDAAFESSVAMHELELSTPDREDRIAMWSALRGDDVALDSTADCAAVARSRCGVSVLARAASMAAQGVSAEAAIESAVRASARGLSAWAQVSADRIPADAWVGPPEVHRELGLLLTRCVARSDAGARLGPLLRGRLSNGVKALFIGASGTGKTLAAQWLADRLARPLVKVDLASVVSKYIGETEKNLAQMLARAEHLDAVLLFDEADSLFGARTDVKQANDRYANMQTNYLLQRLETFHGVAVLTSNSKARFDDAFLRRLDSVVEFPLPDVAERRALWSLHLGDAPSLDPSLLNTIAALVDLPGGHVRNVVLTAALLARQRQQGTGGEMEGEPQMHAEDLREALALEYRKLGQRAPDSLGG